MSESALFISHSSKDAPWVEWLAEHVGLTGVRPYLAQHDPQPGFPLAAKVQQQIDASIAVLVLLTSNSVAAPYVQQEIGYALGRNKLVIPLVQPGVEGTALAMLQGVEYILLDFERPEGGLELLLSSLHNLVEQRDQREREQLLLVLGIAALLVVAAASSAPR